jgi:enamine deaminase RidA (YjgF/YER057c/UK114 family)
MSSVSITTKSFPMDGNKPFALFSRSGDYIWLSGQTARDETGKLVGVGDIFAQERQVFTNIRAILNQAGCDLDSIVRLTTYFAVPLNEELSRRYWEIRREFFGDKPPASTGIQVAGLVTPDTLIEIDAIAYAPVATTERDRA